MKRYWLLILVIMSMNARIFAEDFYAHCNQILVKEVVDSYKIDRDFSKKIALKKWLCSEGAKDSGGNGQIDVDVFEVVKVGVGGGGAQAWKEKNCSDSDMSYSGSKSDHILIQKASSEVVNAWKACVLNHKPNNDHLVCHAKETEDSLLIEIDFGYGLGNINNLEIIGANLVQETRIPSYIRPGKVHIRYKKIKKDDSAYFDLNGETDYLNVSCSFAIPPKPKVEVRACEAFRTEALYAGLISEFDYTFLRDQDQVPVFKNQVMSGYYPCAMYAD